MHIGKLYYHCQQTNYCCCCCIEEDKDVLIRKLIYNIHFVLLANNNDLLVPNHPPLHTLGLD